MTKGTRTGKNARSGPSGASTPRAARTRRPVEVTLSDEARAVLDAESERTGRPRSQLVEALVVADPDEDRQIHEGLLALLAEGPVLLTLDRGDVLLRVLREPIPPSTIVAEGGGPGIHEAILGLRSK